jgi:uncharacterized cofD-like protein
MNAQERWKGLDSFRLWLTPGMGVKRHVLLAVGGAVLLIVGAVGLALWSFGDERSLISAPIEDLLTSTNWYDFGVWLSLLLVMAGALLSSLAVARLNRSLLSNWLPHPGDAARLLRRKVQLAKGPHIVALGGGSGLSNLLRGLRNHTSNLTAVVAVSDNGGSSGRLRAAYDMPAPGDLTDCLAALSDNESELTRLMQYRFTRGQELSGHTFGNLLITTLTEVEGDFGRALRVINSLLNLSGNVYPATSQPVNLVVTKAGGVEVAGEEQLRQVPGAVQSLRMVPGNAQCLPEVTEALLGADLVILGPGSLFSSTIPPLLVPSIRDALNRSHAKLVYVANIMTEVGETDGFDAFEHVEALIAHGVKAPDAVLVNSVTIDAARLESYRVEGADVVAIDAAQFAAAGIELIQQPLLARGHFAQHDSDQLARVLADLATASHRKRLKLQTGPGALAS